MADDKKKQQQQEREFQEASESTRDFEIRKNSIHEEFQNSQGPDTEKDTRNRKN